MYNFLYHHKSDIFHLTYFCCLYLNSMNSGTALPTWKANGITISELVLGFWNDTLKISSNTIELLFLNSSVMWVRKSSMLLVFSKN